MRFLISMYGLIVAVAFINAVEREQRAVDADEPSSIVQIHSSSIGASNMPKSSSIEICKGHCMFVLSFGNTLIVMQKDEAGRVREVTTTHHDLLKDWPARIDIETLPLDLTNNPFIEIGGKDYVLSFDRGPEIWRVSSDDDHREFSPGKVANSSLTEDPRVPIGPIGEPDRFTVPYECVEPPSPENRNINCIVVGKEVKFDYVSWNECKVAHCTNNTTVTSSCEAKSVTLPKEIAIAVFGSASCES